MVENEFKEAWRAKINGRSMYWLGAAIIVREHLKEIGYSTSDTTLPRNKKDIYFHMHFDNEIILICRLKRFVTHSGTKKHAAHHRAQAYCRQCHEWVSLGRIKQHKCKGE